MKISPEHYNLLKSAIERTLKANNVTVSQVDENYKGLSDTRKLFDVYGSAMSMPFASMIVRPIMNTYNDSHIETALKAIWKELENNLVVS